MHLLLLAPLGLLGLAAGVLAEPYRVQRLITFLDLCRSRTFGLAHHPVPAGDLRWGLFGRGLGAGEQKFDLVSDTTDFIFSIICEELGLLGAGLVIVAFASLIWCGLSILTRPSAARPGDGDGGEDPDRSAPPRFRDPLHGQGPGPVQPPGRHRPDPHEGIALPLVSRGGTGWILTSLFLGLLISIDRPRPPLRSGTGTQYPGEPIQVPSPGPSANDHVRHPRRWGSGGHLSPGLAVAERLHSLSPETPVHFACSDRPIDRLMLESAGASFTPIRSTPFSIRPVGLVRFVRGLARGTQVAEVLRSHQAGVVLALGGFVSAPVVRAARSSASRPSCSTLTWSPAEPTGGWPGERSGSTRRCRSGRGRSSPTSRGRWTRSGGRHRTGGSGNLS